MLGFRLVLGQEKSSGGDRSHRKSLGLSVSLAKVPFSLQNGSFFIPPVQGYPPLVGDYG